MGKAKAVENTQLEGYVNEYFDTKTDPVGVNEIFLQLFIE